MISFKKSGNFKKTNSFLEKMLETVKYGNLDRYGRKGVEALKIATPKDTGLTANSWYYKINREKDKTSISFLNSNIKNGVPIAVILQYGHATNNGGWVQGRDYINPSIRPIFEEILNDLRKEVVGK